MRVRQAPGWSPKSGPGRRGRRSSCERPGPTQHQVEHRSQLVLIVRPGEVEEWMRRQDVLGDGAISTDVDDRVRVTLAVRFEGGRHRVTTPRVQEGLQRDDAFVRDPGLAIEIDDAGQVGTLMPE